MVNAKPEESKANLFIKSGDKMEEKKEEKKEERKEEKRKKQKRQVNIYNIS